jgi:hypothetical protein
MKQSPATRARQQNLAGPAPGSDVLRRQQSPVPEQTTLPEPVRTTIRTAGNPLDGSTRRLMESRFNHRFSHVRVHTGAQAAASARSVQAQAYTVGADIVFGAGRYAPQTRSGQWLLAHELAHVAQAPNAISAQRAAVLAAPGARESTGPGTARERDASRAASNALAGKPVHIEQRHSGRSLHRFGEPQNVPELTYVAGQDPQNDGFLNDALTYHRTWGLQPRPINSMEAIVNHLAGSAGRLRRIRIVTHASQQNLFTAMFNGGSPGILEPQLRAFAESDVAGLSAMLGDLVGQTDVDNVVGHLRQNNAAVLRPFGLDQPATAPAGAVAELIKRSTELLFYTIGSGGNQAQVNTITTTLRTVVDGLVQQVQQPAPAGAGVSQADAQALAAAIAGIGVFSFVRPVQPADFVAALDAANAGVANNFRANLNRARARFSSDSWIDIRGCNVGQSQSYLRAVALFFGSGGQNTHVSGPEWFQSFPTLGFRTLTDRDIDGLAADADVMAALDHWVVASGVRQTMTSLRIYYLNMLIQAQQRERAASGAGALSGTLQGPALDLPPILGGDALPGPTWVPSMPELQLTPPSLLQPPSPSLGLSPPTLSNPIVDMAQRQLARLDEPNAELKFYFDAALVLPVQNSADVEDIRLFFKHDLRERAIDNWLDSQWSAAAPGLRALKRGRWNAEGPRRVAALTRLRGGGAVPNQEMVISPDPRYQEHIKSV